MADGFVVAFDVGILLRLAGLDMLDGNAACLRPLMQAVAYVLLPNLQRGLARVTDRLVPNGIFLDLQSGASWRDFPESYGPPRPLFRIVAIQPTGSSYFGF